MSGLNRTYDILYNELERINVNKIDVDTLYTHDRKTGELIPIAEAIPREAEDIVKLVTNKLRQKSGYVRLYQESCLDLCSRLSSNSYKILGYLVGEMKYDNSSYGVTQRDIAKHLSMSSRTVNRAIKELENKNVIAITGKKGSLIYHINPAFVWKGALYRAKYKINMFKRNKSEIIDLFDDE